MDRLYSRYPGGVVGVALLLLRAIIGAWLIRFGVSLGIADPQPSESAIAMLTGVALIAMAFLLVLGIRTPLAGSAGAAFVMGGELYVRAAQVSSGYLDDWFYVLSLVFLAGSIALLGPGAYSVDARLSGWRSISVTPAVPGRSRPTSGGGF
jgi:putative oxidoreductase